MSSKEPAVPGNTDDLDPILPDPVVGQVTNLSRTTRWRKIKRNEFPAPVRLSDRRVGWRKSDIAAWLESRTQ